MSAGSFCSSGRPNTKRMKGSSWYADASVMARAGQSANCVCVVTGGPSDMSAAGRWRRLNDVVELCRLGDKVLVKAALKALFGRQIGVIAMKLVGVLIPVICDDVQLRFEYRVVKLAHSHTLWCASESQVVNWHTHKLTHSHTLWCTL